MSAHRGDLARRRVRRLRRRPEALGASWRRPAAAPVLELGCGTGRVALHLARRGHRVLGLDLDPELIAALAERAAGLPVDGRCGRRPRASSSPEPVALVLAPMQLLQLLDDARRARRLPATGSPPRCSPAAASPRRSSSGMPRAEDDAPPPLPDVREVDGWVYSSLPLEAAVGAGRHRRSAACARRSRPAAS